MGFMEKIQLNHLIQTTVGIGFTALTGACCSRLVAPLPKTQGALIPLVGIIALEALDLKKVFTVPKQALITFSATSLAILSYRFSKGANLNIRPVFVFSVAITAANTAVNFFFTHFNKNSGSTVAAEKTTTNTPLKPQERLPLSVAQAFRAQLGDDRFNKTRKEILDCPKVEFDRDYGADKNQWCNAIFPRIFLGSAMAYGCLVKKEAFQQTDFNPACVKFVISLCPMDETIAECCANESATLTTEQKYNMSAEDTLALPVDVYNRMENARIDAYSTQFGQIPKEFTWSSAGEDLPDKPESWNLLVALNSESGQYPADPENHFSTTFSLLDRVFLSDEEGSVLIHCKQGQSRSAAPLIAWLISRFDVSAEQAENFLRSKRPCVKSKFIDKLKEYETNLKTERLKSS